jgi:16S rRNA (guanine1207-N2)-methyltransferase
LRSARLEMALDAGVFVLPETGQIVVMNPRLGDDLSALPKGRCGVLTEFRTDHDHFHKLGHQMVTEAPTAAVICLPRAKASALDLIARAMTLLPQGAPILIDGQKTDGVDGILNLVRAAGLRVGEVLSKAHGKAFVLTAATPPTGWLGVETRIEGDFITRPGVFSADAPDRGSVLLARVLPDRLGARIADIGAGWGYLSRAILTRDTVKTLDLIEADRVALDCARLNVTDDRAAFHWADATSFKSTRLWDGVVMNPPFHIGRDADPALGADFIRAAQRGLATGGRLWMVANRQLPYLPVLQNLFAEVEEIGRDPVFRLIEARKPTNRKRV